MRGPLRKTATRKWKRHPQDWYVEPSWTSERLFAVEEFVGRIVDPACGEGRIVRSARKAGLVADGSDIAKRAPGFRVLDFFQMSLPVPNIVSNVPFRFAMAFVGHSLNLAEHKVAMILPSGWVQAQTRLKWRRRTPLKMVWFLSPRPSMPPGDLPRELAAEARTGNGTTDFAWVIWDHGYTGHPQWDVLCRDDGVLPT